MDGSALPATAPSRRWSWQLVASIVMAALVVGEIALRMCGLHTPVIYEATDYGYRIMPGQDIRRFGNLIRYNDHGLRNGPIADRPVEGVTRILVLGDSVTNGGAVTDQADTIPCQLEDILRPRFGAIEVLNASAPGWAIANELAWLRRHGMLGSGYLVLLLSGHDLFQRMTPASIVGTHPAFPASRPVFALEEVVRRYVLPRLLRDEVHDPGAAGVAASEVEAARNRQDVESIADIVAVEHGRLLVIFLDQPPIPADETTLRAKRQLFDLLRQRDIPVVSLDEVSTTPDRAALYRDAVHPTPAGNRAIALGIARELESRMTRAEATDDGASK